MMKTTMMFQFLLLGSFFGQTSAIFPCRSHCQDVCDNFVVGSGCWTSNPTQCGVYFPLCARPGFGNQWYCNQHTSTQDKPGCQAKAPTCNWCALDSSCLCNLFGCACKGCGGCPKPSGADDEDEVSDADYMSFLKATTKEKLDTLKNVHCAPMGKTAYDYAFVAEMEELMANGDGEISKDDYENAYFSESEVNPIVSKYCVDPSSAISGMEELKVKETNSKSAKEKNKRTRSKNGK